MRHGETVDNERQIMQGQTQGELNATGVRQAEMLRDQLCHEDIDVFVSSDLKRSIDTCRIIAEPHGKEVQTTPLLRERDWGGFTGRYIPDLKDEVWPDDIESLDALKERAGKFLAFLREQFPPRRFCRRTRHYQQSHSSRLLRQTNERSQTDGEWRNKEVGIIR